MVRTSTELVCSTCGNSFRLSDRCFGTSTSDKALSKLCEEHCFDCAFWLEKVQNPHRHSLVVAQESYRVHYVAYPFVKGCGFGGSRFRFLRNGLLQETRDLWCQGDIPKMFWDKFPVNGEFVTYHKVSLSDTYIAAPPVVASCSDNAPF